MSFSLSYRLLVFFFDPLSYSMYCSPSPPEIAAMDELFLFAAADDAACTRTTTSESQPDCCYHRPCFS